MKEQGYEDILYEVRVGIPGGAGEEAFCTGGETKEAAVRLFRGTDGTKQQKKLFSERLKSRKKRRE